MVLNKSRSHSLEDFDFHQNHDLNGSILTPTSRGRKGAYKAFLLRIIKDSLSPFLVNPRSFTNSIAYYHSHRLARVFGLVPSLNGGIDLVGDSLGIELKCRSDRFHPTWAIHSYQINDFPAKHADQELYWGFVLYHLTCPVERIPEGSERFLGLFVREPRVWFLPWDWVRTFKIWEPKTGPYVYVHEADLPSSGFRSEQRSNYILHVPKESGLERRLIGLLSSPKKYPARPYRIR